MNSELGDVCLVTKLAGFEFTQYFDYCDDGEIIAIRGLNIKDGNLDLSEVKRISRNISEKLPRSKLYKNDILLTYTGTLGEVAIIEEDDKFHLAPNVCLVRPENIDPYFLFCYMRSSTFKKYIDSFSVGTTQRTIPMKNIREIPINIPDVKYQESSSKMIRFLDDKIELNQKMNQTLEGIAKALFKSWFIDFDPVKAKAEGRSTGLSQDISDLFPDSFEDSELGEIPKGWDVATLADLCSVITKGTTPTSIGGKFDKNGEINFIKVESLSDLGDLISSKFAKIDVSTDELLKRSKLKEGDVLLSIAGTIGRSAVITSDSLPANTNQALAILRCDGVVDFVLQTLRTNRVQETFSSKIVQGVQANLSLGEIKVTQCVTPVRNVLDKLMSYFQLLRIAKNVRQQEIKVLFDLRDTLLPKLITGELRIKDAEKYIEEAGI
tara:strand:+ start:1672 stop:2982 length:1311 start_codon:yes stop_codon:yes gene_type:complete